jgi:hypothetical protein
MEPQITQNTQMDAGVAGIVLALHRTICVFGVICGSFLLWDTLPPPTGAPVSPPQCIPL